MALHPLHIDHLPHLAHLPSYLDLSLRRFKTSDVAHISLNESLLTFPMEIGSLLHGVTVPSGSMVNPDTPAAQPPEGVASDEMLSAGAFICDATGSPVTIVKPIVFKEKISSGPSMLTCTPLTPSPARAFALSEVIRVPFDKR